MNAPYAGFSSDLESISGLLDLAHESEILTDEEAKNISDLVDYAQNNAPYDGKAVARTRFRQAWDAHTTEVDGEVVEFSLGAFFEDNISENDPDDQGIDIPLSVAAEVMDELSNHPRDDEFPEEFDSRDAYLETVRGEIMQCILAATNIVVIEATEGEAHVPAADVIDQAEAHA